jgi:hypothetical protein
MDTEIESSGYEVAPGCLRPEIESAGALVRDAVVNVG